MESRIHGDVYVRFGGERLETYRPKGRQGALRLACRPAGRNRHMKALGSRFAPGLDHQIFHILPV